MSDFEAFARDWEATERSRHARLIEQLKREYREAPRTPASVEPVIDAPYSVRLQRSLPRQQNNVMHPQNWTVSSK
ncbi:MAG: hypothetical protein F6K28_49840 [Microcoleus sp. SIO2G3]|nr:hypothetical protein [Microcoleus sp. SIO2G3]